MRTGKLWAAFRPYLWITLASAVFALGFDWCYVPNQITLGGMTGLGQIIHAIVPAIPVGSAVIALNLPLFLLGWRLLGWKLLASSLFATAATSLGVDLLARKDAKHLFILGAGKQAPFQIAATLLLRPAIDKVYIADPMFPDNAVQFAAHIAQQLSDDFGIDASGVEFLPALDMAAAVGDSDAIITVTPSRKPIIQKAWLKPGTHLSCLGSDMESKQEIESTIFQGAAFYADDRAQCIRVGEMELPIKQGVISADDITGEIGDLIDGKVPGRTSDTQTTIFDATGLYILDLAAAKVAIDRALAEGVGLQADL